MNLTAARPTNRPTLGSLKKLNVRSGGVYSAIIILALVAFEAFNYSTTAYALRDLLGDLRFAGLRWATLMALAFCSLDFAGIARIITQKSRPDGKKESWYLFGAWLLAAAFNAGLTWWGVSLALSNHSLNSALISNTEKLTSIVPVLVAVLVWVVRVLIIGTLTTELEQRAEKRLDGVAARREAQRAGFPLESHNSGGYTRTPISNPASRPAAARGVASPAYKATVNSPNQLTRQNDFINAEEQYH